MFPREVYVFECFNIPEVSLIDHRIIQVAKGLYEFQVQLLTCPPLNHILMSTCINDPLNLKRQRTSFFEIMLSYSFSSVRGLDSKLKDALAIPFVKLKQGPGKLFHCFDFMQKYKTENKKSVLTNWVKFPYYFIVSILIFCHSIFSFTSKVQIMIAPL